MKLIICSLVFACILLGHNLVIAQPPYLYLGSTGCKMFYTSPRNFSEGNVDYAYGLQHVCKNLYGMQAAAIETMEEYEVLNRWFMNNYGNGSASPYFWTSGSKFGNNSLTWASTGSKYELENVPMSGDWIPGCGCQDSSPVLSWTKCLTIFKTCSRQRKGSARRVAGARAIVVTNPGETGLIYHGEPCDSIQTMLFYRDCREKHRVICQRVVC